MQFLNRLETFAFEFSGVCCAVKAIDTITLFSHKVVLFRYYGTLENC